MSIPATLKKYTRFIDDISDERHLGDGIWVYLKYGYCNGDIGSHIIHEDTLKECASYAANIRACDCDDCRHGAAEATAIHATVRDIKQGTYVKRRLDATKTYSRGEYCKSQKKFSLIDIDDVCREIFVKPDTILFIA
jgi:hypothetical protein